MPKVSIIVPCYNQAKYLPDTLDSVLAQTYKDWECVIVNDGSTDNTEDVVLEYCQKDKRIKYISQNNCGVSASRNRGIRESDGYYILPLDGDDIIEATYLEKAVKYFEANPLTTLVYCKADFFGIKNEPWILPEYNYESFIWNNSIFVSALYKRADYDKTNGYNNNMDKGFEDWDFWLSLLNKQSIVYRINEVLFHYRIKDQSRNVNAIISNLDLLLNQIYFNHKSIYDVYSCDIIKYHNIIESQEKELYAVYNSKSFKLGHFLLTPFRLIRNILHKTIK